MIRCECVKEQTSQSIYSPGLVTDEEPIVLALIDPLTFGQGSIKALKHDQLKKSSMSVVRANHINAALAKSLTVDVLIMNDPTRTDHGFAYALCREIRAIHLNVQGIGAFCVIDDALEQFHAHAHLGYSNVEEKKNDRITARGNLLRLFMKRGFFPAWVGQPFAT